VIAWIERHVLGVLIALGAVAVLMLVLAVTFA